MNPLLGIFYHWLGGLAAASFYIPYRGVKRWSWETYWLVGGVFSWLIAPWVLAALLVPNLIGVLTSSPSSSLVWAYIFGAMWGLGGLTFGLTMRYLGIALGMAVALGYCAVFGTLMPPIFAGEFGSIIATPSGRTILLGVGVCLAGIIIAGLAGMSKERELPEDQKKSAVKEFNFTKGMIVATFSGIMSSCFAYGLAAGQPIGELAKQSLLTNGGSDLWQNLPVLIVVLLGGFTTNFIWCIILNIKNKSGREYLSFSTRNVAEMSATEAVAPWDSTTEKPHLPVPILSNYIFSALAGITWYLQFFFYSMGETRMGEYKFSSWTMHMASIIIFSTLWGIAFREWKGTSKRTHLLVALGLFTLIASTLVVGYGNFLKGGGPAH